MNNYRKGFAVYLVSYSAGYWYATTHEILITIVAGFVVGLIVTSMIEPTNPKGAENE